MKQRGIRLLQADQRFGELGRCEYPDTGRRPLAQFLLKQTVGLWRWPQLHDLRARLCNESGLQTQGFCRQ